ncbi:MAG: acylneuraminate cytidylyltransferase family protein [Firmicutes bacterium]|nr:acylneuraminate cytidylyltransferase family protein [Bacillota bacterium]
MIQNKIVIALIPIKEHSERVKNKNFRMFGDKPLYHHILNTLERTYAVDEVIINTDSHVVMNEAPQLFSKVRIHDRPQDLIGDFVSVNKIIEHDISKTEGDIYLQTHATNPLIKSETIASALRKFLESGNSNDSLFSVNRFQSRFYDQNGIPVNHKAEELLRTQDLPPLYEENSCLYIFSKESFKKRKTRIGSEPLLYEIPKIESIDIDDEFTFKLAELMALYSKET